MPGPKKFILIDHTIEDLAGHYYEYAVHVLEAARQSGYQPVLATNRKFRPDPNSPWPVYPVYKYGFWSALRSSPEARDGGWRESWEKFWFGMRCRFRFSGWNLAWSKRDRLGEFVLSQPVALSSIRTVGLMAPPILLFKFLRFLVLLVLIPLAAIWGALRLVGKMFRLPGIRDYFGALFSDFVGAGKLAGHLWSRRKEVESWFRQFRCLRRFAADTHRVLRKVKLGEEDIIFIPTVSTIEMMGLSVYLDRTPTPPGASWHLLFRRNIYTNREGDYPPQEPNLGGMRGSFLRFGPKLTARRVFFHTDTEELTRQHNRLGGATFSTLPIPHSRRPVDREAARRGPLNVIYVGDARSEKGYQFIPHIVQELWWDTVAPGKVRFTLQSNDSTRHGDPYAVVARAQLDSMPGDAIRLLMEPLTSAQYQELLLSGDINLLLYDRNNYYARSSGILVESLSAGVPPVVPAGSWLSRQFLAETHHHLESWRERVRPAQTVGARDLRWRLKSDTTAAADATPRWGEEITLAFSPILTRLRMPAGARWLILTARFTGDIQDLRVGVEEFDERGDPVAQRLHPPRLIEAERATGKSVVLIPLSGASAALEVSLSSPFPQREVVLQDFQLEFFRCGEQDRPPLGAVGLTYYGIEDVGRLLRDLITHYEHYRQTAREFSRLWLEYHNGPRLIAEIEQAAGRANAGRPQPTAAVVGS